MDREVLYQMCTDTPRLVIEWLVPVCGNTYSAHPYNISSLGPSHFGTGKYIPEIYLST